MATAAIHFVSLLFRIFENVSSIAPFLGRRAEECQAVVAAGQRHIFFLYKWIDSGTFIALISRQARMDLCVVR